MRHKLLPILLALVAGAAVLTSCASGNAPATPDEAVNRVHPEGEGNYYDPDLAEVTPAQTETVPQTEQATTEKTKIKKKSESSTAPSTAPTTEPNTADSTQPTTNANVPKDNITQANLNPNIGAIQSDIMAQIQALTVKSISLSKTSLTVEAGKSDKLEIGFDPTNAAVKTCSLQMSNGNAVAKLSGTTITVTGKTAGTATLTVTSKNGHKATCNITVTRSEQVVTDDTVLPHSELCTAANANRWNASITAKLSSLGMTANPNLGGSSFSLSTANLSGSNSYHTAEAALMSMAETEAIKQTGGEYSGYEFNCVASQSNGECEFTVVINKAE